jgi:hypothetical protein
MEIPIAGALSSGEPYQSAISVASAFTLLLMKLHAFRDRSQDEEKDLGRHHALDIYRIIAMMPEKEFEWTRQQISTQRKDPALIQAARIVREYFESSESLGSLRLREHALWNAGMALDDFLSAMHDLLLTQDVPEAK